MHNFDKLYDRRQTDSEKWDSIEKKYNKPDLLPLWVADMDFKAPIDVTKALADYVAAGIYGYSMIPDSLFEAIISWQVRRHHYHLSKDEILFNSGVVPSIALAVQAFTEPGDAIMIHDPVYPPFTSVVQQNERQLIRSKLLKRNGHFEMNFAEMETLILQHQVKMLILCNPHNPGGRVWSAEELRQLGQLCCKHKVLVVSDEIHQDLVFSPYEMTSFQTVDPSFADFSIVLTAATKTFNLAGIKNSMIFIKNSELRKRFTTLQQKNVQTEINTFGLIGTTAAYDHGEQWLEELLVYLKKNIAFACDYLEENLPKISFLKPEGTYLIWLDFSAYGLTDQELDRKMIEEAGVVLNPGRAFGPSGRQHMRLNVACPKETLARALTLIAQTFSED